MACDPIETKRAVNLGKQCILVWHGEAADLMAR